MRLLALLTALCLTSTASAQGLIAFRLDLQTGSYVQTTPYYYAPAYYAPPYLPYSLPYSGGYGVYDSDVANELRLIRWGLEDQRWERGHR